MNTPAAPVKLVTGRFERFSRIDWWDQQRLRSAKVLVVGAGALGNEVVKNLSLIGVGHLAVADMDRIEESNLSRSALFSAADEGKFKAEILCQSARRLWPEVHATPLVGNIMGDVGRGWFRWADLVVGALDNREARVYVNSTCAMLGRGWIDGGIDMLNGIVRGFTPSASACYECTMNDADWELLNQRRGCSLLARRAFDAGGTPTSPTTASIIGAMQAQEVIKHLHGLPSLAGEGFVFEGRTHGSYQVRYDIKSNCPWHETPPPIETCESLGSDSTLREVCAAASRKLGPLAALDLEREIVTSLTCPACQATEEIFRPVHSLTAEEAICAECGTERRPDYVSSIAADSPWQDKTVRQFGMPAWDILWARSATDMLGIELAADRVASLDSPDF